MYVCVFFISLSLKQNRNKHLGCTFSCCIPVMTCAQMWPKTAGRGDSREEKRRGQWVDVCERTVVILEQICLGGRGVIIVNIIGAGLQSKIIRIVIMSSFMS